MNAFSRATLMFGGLTAAALSHASITSVVNQQALSVFQSDFFAGTWVYPVDAHQSASFSSLGYSQENNYPLNDILTTGGSISSFVFSNTSNNLSFQTELATYAYAAAFFDPTTEPLARSTATDYTSFTTNTAVSITISLIGFPTSTVYNSPSAGLDKYFNVDGHLLALSTLNPSVTLNEGAGSHYISLYQKSQAQQGYYGGGLGYSFARGDTLLSLDIQSATAVPEPASMITLGFVISQLLRQNRKQMV